tara:strand:+ start:560 stop:967 length:408 start_codon:yes stop_codon:yes gene_type:complete
MGVLTILFGDKKKPTFKEVQKDVMKYARENDLGEMEAGKMLRSQLKRYDIPYPKGMATDEEFKQQLQDKGDKPVKKKARGGMVKKNKAQMMKGGMANGKVHMYSAGGSVTDNAGLRALKASGPKGMEAYKKITGK